jgi:hypothetical protein
MTGEPITAVTTLYYTITSYARKASNAVMEIAATRLPSAAIMENVKIAVRTVQRVIVKGTIAIADATL